MIDGVLDFSPWQIVLVTAVMCHITLASVTIYLHRSQAHRALNLHPAVSHFFRFWLWLTTGMRTLEWVAIHRKHHAHCEVEHDPHSPVVYGLRQVLLEGSELYRAEAACQETLDKYGHGTPDDAIERQLYSAHPVLGIVLMGLIDVALFGAIGLTVFAVQMLCIPVLAAGVINGLGHFWGYRNYETNDASTNITPWAFLICGEELHNNHHAYPSSARLSARRFEFDLGWVYIRALAFLGLAQVRRLAPRPKTDTSKSVIDVDTAAAIVRSRMHVMQRYARRVIMPVHKAEVAHADQTMGRKLRIARRPLICFEGLMNEVQRRRLQVALNASEPLKTVYEYRRSLQAIWDRAGASHEKLSQDLQEWCAQAESSGIKALREFSERLRSYSLEPASTC
ncbi:MAG: fatty acid desaturase [Pseudomonadota bacterium]